MCCVFGTLHAAAVCNVYGYHCVLLSKPCRHIEPYANLTSGMPYCPSDGVNGRHKRTYLVVSGTAIGDRPSGHVLNASKQVQWMEDLEVVLRAR